jgi:hypothetical protein
MGQVRGISSLISYPGLANELIRPTCNQIDQR